MSPSPNPRFERRVALPFRAEPAFEPPAALRALIDCGKEASTVLWRLDWPQLTPHDRECLEAGESLPAVHFAWLERALALMRRGVRCQWPLGLLNVPSRELLQLSIDDLMSAMSGAAWADNGQVAVLWGFAQDALASPSRIAWPLACRGAVFPCGDGLNVAWWASAAEIAAFAAAEGGASADAL